MVAVAAAGEEPYMLPGFPAEEVEQHQLSVGDWRYYFAALEHVAVGRLCRPHDCRTPLGVVAAHLLLSMPDEVCMERLERLLEEVQHSTHILEVVRSVELKLEEQRQKYFGSWQLVLVGPPQLRGHGAVRHHIVAQRDAKVELEVAGVLPDPVFDLAALDPVLGNHPKGGKTFHPRDHHQS